MLTPVESKAAQKRSGSFALKPKCPDKTGNTMQRMRDFAAKGSRAPILSFADLKKHSVRRNHVTGGYDKTRMEVQSFLLPSFFACATAVSVYNGNAPGTFLDLRGEGKWVMCSGGAGGTKFASDPTQMMAAGTYGIKYTCTDASGNAVSKCRTVVQVTPAQTISPTSAPTHQPTTEPTACPTSFPTASRTHTHYPTKYPTSEPTAHHCNAGTQNRLLLLTLPARGTGVHTLAVTRALTL
jgi:hypothetical protein